MRIQRLRSAGVVLLMAAVIAGFGMARARQVEAAGDNDLMTGHMTMTKLRPVRPGDRQRADQIVAAARRFADQYKDYRVALEDGFQIFHPEVTQDVYHFTLGANGAAAQFHFDASRPTSLLYVRVPAAKADERPGYKLIGVMYTAPFRATEDELDSRVPLSIARWHLHTNFCMARGTGQHNVGVRGGKFGLQGSIATKAACDAVGGIFVLHVFGWMVHVYPYETDPARIWAAGMDDPHGMQHDQMPLDMPM